MFGGRFRWANLPGPATRWQAEAYAKKRKCPLFGDPNSNYELEPELELELELGLELELELELSRFFSFVALL